MFLGLELHPHDAKKTGITLPNGHAAGDWRVLHQFCKRGFHLQPAGKKHYLAAFVKTFRIKTSFDCPLPCFQLASRVCCV
jgi:hypothetical protein